MDRPSTHWTPANFWAYRMMLGAPVGINLLQTESTPSFGKANEPVLYGGSFVLSQTKLLP